MWNPMQNTLDSASAAQVELERFKRMQEMLARMQAQNVAPVNPSMMAPSQASPTSRPRLPRQGEYGGGGAGPLQVDETGAPRQDMGPRLTPEGVVLPPLTKPAAQAQPPVPTPVEQQPVPAPVAPSRTSPAGRAPLPQPGMAAPEATARNVPSAEKVNQMAWDKQSIMQRAQQNVSKPEQAKGFLDKVNGWMDKVGSVFDVRTKGADSQAIHPEYGVPNGMVWQAQRAALFNAGVTLMAAGMPNTPQNRAAILSQMGDALSGVSRDIYNVAQAQLMSRGKEEDQYEQFADNIGVGQRNAKTGKIEYLHKFGDAEAGGLDFETASKLVYNPSNPDKSMLRSVQTNASMIENYNEAEQLLLAGIYAGKTGPMREWAVGYLRQIGLATDEQIAQAARSERFRSALGDLVLNKMAMLGGSDSNEELKKLTEMVGADTSMNPEAMLETVRRGRAKELKGYERNRQSIESIAGNVVPAQRRAFAEAFQVPEVSMPGTADTGEQQGGVVSPEDIAEGQEMTVDGVRVKRMKGKLYYFDNGKWEPLE